jgi:uncharacterized protein YbjT (DUF2867 family)
MTSTTHIDEDPTVIIGGSGKTGRRVAERLVARGRRVRPVSRSSERPFDWHDPSTWAPALAGAGSLYLTYYPDLSVPGAAERVDGLCRVAVDEGVGRVVLLAGRGEPQVKPAEDAVRSSGLAHTILECAFFAQNFSEGVAVPVDDVIYFPAGDTPEPFIDCDDIADVAVAALTEEGHDGATYELTGPRALTFGEACAAMSEAAGRTIRFEPVSFARYGEMIAPHFEPEEVRFFLELFEFLLDGHNSRPTDGVQRALGRPATDFRDYARRAAGAWQ